MYYNKFSEARWTHGFKLLTHYMGMCESWMSYPYSDDHSLLMSCSVRSGHFLVDGFIFLSLLLGLVCFPHRFCRREWHLILRVWIASSYVTCGFLVSADLAAFDANSLASSLLGLPMLWRYSYEFDGFLGCEDYVLDALSEVAFCVYVGYWCDCAQSVI